MTGLRGLLKGNRQREIWTYVQSILNGDNAVSSGSKDPSSRISGLPQLQTVTELSAETAPTDSEPMTVFMGEQLLDDYRVIDLPEDPSTTEASLSSADEGLVNTALLARIEFLEAECTRLQKSDRKQQHFGIDEIKQDDHLIHFYTGFPSFAILLSFYHFLEPVVDKLQYWGSKSNTKKLQRARKLTPMNQLFMTLVKLRLDLKLTNLAF